MYVSHDEDDLMWQFLCGKTYEAKDAGLVSLQYDLDPSVGGLKDMPCGFFAERESQEDAWVMKKR